MRTISFTKAVLMELPVPDAGKRLEYADSVVNGLRLRVTSRGSKVFVRPESATENFTV
ncbi:hypothetical protein [Citrobacter sp. Igbk 14]|uniref:hypothetical protein n=1 Tax=Citrobacter sp. Igbk 14 TaxID=2963960 RepID=UPI002302CDCA|nr:hypothetical protein [Citrobacter sp. Igbk 14]MDA8512601.1 hypothetical protein [Citrobacter sp. Igbk 14]